MGAGVSSYSIRQEMKRRQEGGLPTTATEDMYAYQVYHTTTTTCLLTTTAVYNTPGGTKLLSIRLLIVYGIPDTWCMKRTETGY